MSALALAAEIDLDGVTGPLDDEHSRAVVYDGEDRLELALPEGCVLAEHLLEEGLAAFSRRHSPDQRRWHL